MAKRDMKWYLVRNGAERVAVLRQAPPPDCIAGPFETKADAKASVYARAPVPIWRRVLRAVGVGA